MTGVRTLLISALMLAAVSVVRATPTPDAVSPGDSAAALYSELTGTVALENERVIVKRFSIAPGQSTGREAHGAHQLLIFVKGGVLTFGSTGRHVLWPDGRVVWFDRAGQDGDSTNTGPGPIELLWVVLKPSPPRSNPPPPWGYLSYPNVAGEDLLENDWLIVQRYKLQAGQWEGIHAHNPNTFYVFIKGGQWSSKSNSHPNGVAGSAPDGTIAWMDTIALSEQHQSGNTGSAESDVVWVALKH